MKKINSKIRYSLNDLLIFEDSQFNSYINREVELGNLNYIEPDINITKPLREVTNAGFDYEVKRIIDEIYVLVQDRVSSEDFELIKKKSKRYIDDATYYIKKVNNTYSTYVLTNSNKVIKEIPVSDSEKAKDIFNEYIKDFNEINMYSYSFSSEERKVSILQKNGQIISFKENLSLDEAKEYAKNNIYPYFDSETINVLIENLIEENYLNKDEIISYANQDFNPHNAEKYFNILKEDLKKKPKMIIQAMLFNEELNFMGIADLLVRVDNHYEVWDIKRANVPKAKFVMQICAYADILSRIQEKPKKGRILLGGDFNFETKIQTNYEEFIIEDYFSYYRYIKNKFFDFHNNEKTTLPQPQDLFGKYNEKAKEYLKDKIESITNIDNNDLIILKDQDVNTKDDLINKDIHTLPESHLHRLREQASLEKDYKILNQFEGEPGNLIELDDFKIYDIYVDCKYTDTLDKEGFVCFYSLYTITETGKEIHEYFYSKNKYMENATFQEFIKRVKELSQKSIRNSQEEYEALDDKGLIFCFNNKVYDLLTQVASEYGHFDLGFLHKKRKNNRIKFLQDFLINSVVLNIQEYTMENISELLNFKLENLSLGFEAPIISLLNSQTEYEWKMKEDSEEMLRSLSFEKLSFLNKLHNWMLSLRDENKIKFVPEENRLIYKNIKESIESKIEKDKEKEIESHKKQKELEDNINACKDKLISLDEETKRQKTEKELEKYKKSLDAFLSKRKEAKEKAMADAELKVDVKEKEKEYRFNSYTHHKLTEKEKVLVLINQLRKFHKRETDEANERMLKLKTASLKELLLDMDCVADLKRIDEINIERVKKDNSIKAKTILYKMPPQDFRLDIGDSITLVKNNKITGKIKQIDSSTVAIRYTKAGLILGVDKKNKISITKENISSKTSYHISNTITDVFLKVDPEKDYLNLNPALYDLLLKNIPNKLEGRLYNDDDCKSNQLVPKIVDAVSKMDKTTLIIQGPPGAGKSYTAKQVIKEILKNEPFARIGISSNSHKAIDNLLFAVNEVTKGFECMVLKDMELSKYKKNEEYKKAGIFCSRDNDKEFKERMNNNRENPTYAEIFGGTVYALRNTEMDYLFVDEAGQVALANIIAMGAKARNIILIGDQNQLPQPTQGSHPGQSGLSSLEYYLDSVKKVDNDQGFFLGMTRRMNKELTGVVSKYFYENALFSENESNPKFHTILKSKVYKEKGLQFIPVNHKNRTKYSIEEIDRIEKLVDEIINSYEIKTLDENGNYTDFRKVNKEDIIIVSPFNMQVLKLKEKLPDCKVGTVDKFQGQEAPIVIYSLAASEPSGQKGIDFILNPNRMNVALSRGKALAFVVGSEELISNKVETMEELKLLNMISEIFQMK